MKRLFSNTAILVFFCIIMGGIIMLDCIIAVGQTKQMRGIADHFSDSTIRFSVLQADIPEAFSQANLLQFIDEHGSEIRNFSSTITSKQGAEFYSSVADCFSQADTDSYGVWLREDQYQEWINSGNTSFYYKNHWYTVLGSYPKNQTPEAFILDIKGELTQSPNTAMNGTFYLDCGNDTLSIYHALASQIQATNSYAQVTLIESQADGYTFSRIMEYEDALYYLLQMGLLLFLNLINFGNIAGHWVQTREREIFVRRMAGGSSFNVFMDLILPFSAVTFVSIDIGMITALLVGFIFSNPTTEAIFMGGYIGLLQWFILLFFGSYILIKKIRLPIISIRKSEV